MHSLQLEELIAREHLAELQREAARQRLVQEALSDRQSRHGLIHGRLVEYSRRALIEVGRRMVARSQRQQPDMPC